LGNRSASKMITGGIGDKNKIRMPLLSRPRKKTTLHFNSTLNVHCSTHFASLIKTVHGPVPYDATNRPRTAYTLAIPMNSLTHRLSHEFRFMIRV
jgi:hypothetical protein